MKFQIIKKKIQSQPNVRQSKENKASNGPLEIKVLSEDEQTSVSGAPEVQNDPRPR